MGGVAKVISNKITMLSQQIKQEIEKDDKKIGNINYGSFDQPKYNPKEHYKDLTSSNFFYALLTLRHYIKMASDYYFGVKQEAKNIDLFMLTQSVSSPMGPGSDSEPIKIKLGEIDTFLVDSSQFGFEPLLLNNFDKVYCYFPSMRGEDPDNRHLNQFFHCELEIKGILEELIPVIEGYIRTLCKTVLLMNNTISKISENCSKTKNVLKKIVEMDKFPRIRFDEAVDILVNNGHKNLINFTDHGRDISSKGEIELMKILNLITPIWMTGFDRDRVPFYQKPDPNDKNKTVNADLLFPPLIEGAFGGEIVGSGQRQDNPEEMYESLARQNNLSPEFYEWYIDLRRISNYKTTSGFGLGIERFIAWALAKNSIQDMIPYPRLKNIKTCP